MPEIKFFELAAQVLPTIMIALIIELRTYTAIIFPNGLPLESKVSDSLLYLSNRQLLGFMLWLGTAFAFVLGESVSFFVILTYRKVNYLHGFSGGWSTCSTDLLCRINSNPTVYCKTEG